MTARRHHRHKTARRHHRRVTRSRRPHATAKRRERGEIRQPADVTPPAGVTPPAAPDPDDAATPDPDDTVSSSPFGTEPFAAAQLGQLAAIFSSSQQPPAFLVGIYKAAGRRYDVPWKVLAAINGIETNYGQDLQISPAGAIGWMQFMPQTWLRWEVSVDGRGAPNPYDPRDAIFSAARYLAANGAATNLRAAIFAYNHAVWYVDAVLWRAQMITGGSRPKLPPGYALPLDRRYMRTLGRTDDGVDIEDAPDGAAVYSITPGVVTAVASDPTGFGPDYPVVLATAGPLAGQYIYYGHVAASLVSVGERVLAGQPIAIVGHAGDAAPLDHGHIEIGFCDASGDPLDHHGPGADAATPAGEAMRRVLIALSASFGINNF